MNKRFVGSFVFCVAVVAIAVLVHQLSARAQQAPVDLILVNGRVVTADDSRPEAEAIAVRGDTIAAVGTTAEIRAMATPGTKVVDLAGRLAIPGFIEGHGHFMGLGMGLMNLDLMPAKSWDAILTQVASAAETAKPGQWIIGRGWHQEKWTSVPDPNDEGFPTH